jgi:hypothetical protein
MKHLFTVIIAALVCLSCRGSEVRDAQKELGIGNSSWKVLSEDETTLSWLVEPGLGVTLMVQPGYSKILLHPEDKTALYASYRNEALGYKGGLVEVETRAKSGAGFALVTMKFPNAEISKDLNSTGRAYQMNAIIPTYDKTYVIQVAAVETGVTGTREATVMLIYMQEAGIKDLKEASKKFQHDPYDHKYDDGALFTVSDERRWDKDFPTHPLTRIRTMMEKIVDSLTLDAKIINSALIKSTTLNHSQNSSTRSNGR